jgi:crossover junction endodeoxyribonuclease RusA
MSDRVRLTVPGAPVPLQRSRTSSGRHYLPARSRAYRELVQGEWLAAGRPSLGDAPFAASARFIGARANSDLDNLVKALLDALNGLAFADDRQLVCLSGCHKMSADADGPRAELELWAVDRLVAA